jgi:hypothetical protein
MKTTIDLPDGLLERAKSMAAKHNTTLKSLIEEGLRWVLSRSRHERFTLRDAGVPGEGVSEGQSEGDWDQTRDLIYRGRGA